MDIKFNHNWQVSIQEAIQIQNDLKQQVVSTGEIKNIKTVAGIDVGFKRGVTRAVVVVLSFPQLELVEQSIAHTEISFPYVPGLLTFREGPAILEALSMLKTEPDLLIFDGQGIAHPRRLGIASHIGVLVDKPSIGCAKSRLWGKYEEPLNKVGATSDLISANELIGKVLVTKENEKPLFISLGHKISLEQSVEYVMSCTKEGNRLPQTTVYAHNLASDVNKE